MELNQLIRKRGGIKCKLTNFVNFVDEVKRDEANVNEETICELKHRIEGLQLVLSEFDDIQGEIESVCPDENLDSQYIERDDFVNRYHKYNAIANTVVKHCDVDNISQISGENHSRGSIRSNAYNAGRARNNSDSNKVEVKLPVINLPKFSDAIQKFHYLKASLEPDPLKVIESLEFSATNYTIAWKLLCNRYNNKRLLINTHIKALFNLNAVVKDSASSLRTLRDSVLKHLRTLETLGQPIDKWDPLIIYIITTKLDRNTACEWEKTNIKYESPTLTEMHEFLKNRANLLESVEFNVSSIKNGDHRFPQTGKRGLKSLHVSDHVSGTRVRCNFCSKPHKIYKCPEFQKLSVSERSAKVIELKLCENCLCTGHDKVSCRTEGCKLCKQRHNRLLHVSEPNYQPNEINDVALMSHEKSSYILLSTAKVYIFDTYGNVHECNVLLDSGSQPNFITKSLVRKLKLDEKAYNMSIHVINNNVSSNVKSKCEVQIKSRCNKEFSLTISCLVLPQITGNLPSVHLRIDHWNLPTHVKLADPNFNVPKEIDLLIGARHFWELIKGETYHHTPDASRIINEDFYVDDCISGFKTEQEAIERCKEIAVIMTSAGFKLRKWRSNSAYILSNLSDTKDPLSTLQFEDREIKTIKEAPFLDKHDVLRVGGRLKNSSLPFDVKHPPILDAKHTFTKLMFKNQHERLLHTGAQRWSRDYMCNLQQRCKWSRHTLPVRVGELVLIKAENLPSAQWPLARVVELHPGKDGTTRVVSVKTNKGIFKRSIVKICPLPVVIDSK
ncbi:hypothetical protein NQ317_019938 [Molorchus minor]|uniref:DUF5641 domain-containing protein n=1 Tax=Molorchus minor TaxID=1323400 RepID=A0ABQ9K6S6_9CUCU|nr:hypothetical protein NQ317_019938 [Molorchus minor]